MSNQHSDYEEELRCLQHNERRMRPDEARLILQECPWIKVSGMQTVEAERAKKPERQAEVEAWLNNHSLRLYLAKHTQRAD